MKEKNLKFKTIIVIIMIVLLTSGISVYATSVVCKYVSTDVKYKRNETEMSVKDALDELYQYESQKLRVYYLGTGRSIDVSTVLPNDYKNLTADNFIVEIAENCSTDRVVDGSSYTTSTFKKISKNYNPENGVLTISEGILYLSQYNASRTTLYETRSSTAPIKVYAVIGNIQ